MNLSLLNILAEKLPYFVLNFMSKILNDEKRKKFQQKILNEFNKYSDNLDSYNLNSEVFNTIDNAILSNFSDLQFPLDKNNCLDENELEIAEKILEDLLKIKKILINSGKEIENTFNNCLYIITDDEIKNIDFKMIHLELFSEKILSSKFISGLLILILKNEDKQLKNLKNLVKEICNFPCGICEFKNFKMQIEKYFKLKQLLYNKEGTGKLKEIFCIDENIDCNTFEHINDNLYIQNNENKNKKEERDIDEWVNYIGLDDEKKKRRKKKKNKNKSNKENRDINNNNENFNESQNDFYDEIELIKKSLTEDSCNKYSIRKIKPKLNQDWINQIKIISIKY
jgi:predicted Zn-ribbon and HTH transcriptional regulator